MGRAPCVELTASGSVTDTYVVEAPPPIGTTSVDLLRPNVLLPVLTILLVAAPTLTPTDPADAAVGPTADQLEDADDEVEALDDDIATAEEALTAIEAELEDLDVRFELANRQTARADQLASEAERAADLAREMSERTQADLVAARTELNESRRTLDDVVRDAYMHGGRTTSPMLAVAEGLGSGEDPSDVTDVLHFVDAVVADRGQAVEETERLLKRTNQLIRETRTAERAAEEEAAAANAALKAAATRNAELLALVEQADAAAREQQRLLTDLRDDRTGAASRLERLEAAQRAAAEVADAAITITDLGGGLVSVGGITVAASLGPALEDLLEAGRRDGIVLGGYGYRSPESTARLRRANGCPDVYESPASSCRVPTARPGESIHEQGLAIDFTYQGQTICYPRRASSCTGNTAFDWLAANAGQFGLRVLDSEAWHWSTNGQ